MRVTAFVPARCGSKAIRLKNIRNFFGQPLIYWCLNALQEAQSVHEVIVATDCDEIENCVTSFGLTKVKVYRRKASNAQDHSATEDVMIEYINSTGLDPEQYLLLVQATSPFTRAADFDQAVTLLKSNTYDSVISCARVKRFFWNDHGQPLNYDYRERPRRQNFSGTLMENGAFYLNLVKNILEFKNRLSGHIGVYEMETYTTLEIDEEEDWIQGEQIMGKYQLSEAAQKTKHIKLFLSDVDGVLTDAGMYYTEAGDEIKKFNTYDGMAFNLLQAKGLKVGILTKEDRELNRRRAKKLNLDFDFHGIQDKMQLVQQLCQDLGITLEEVAYIGDDINDLELLQAVGIAACPLNARPEVKHVPGIYQLKTAGGSGALRELAEQILLK